MVFVNEYRRFFYARPHCRRVVIQFKVNFAVDFGL